MPDLFLLTHRKNAEILTANIDIIGPRLAQATANAFPDLGGDPKKVAVFVLSHEGGFNVPPIQILGMASQTEERIPLLDNWRAALVKAWLEIMVTNSMSRYIDIFPVGPSEVWPIMPLGAWSLMLPRSPG